MRVGNDDSSRQFRSGRRGKHSSRRQIIAGFLRSVAAPPLAADPKCPVDRRRESFWFSAVRLGVSVAARSFDPPGLGPAAGRDPFEMDRDWLRVPIVVASRAPRAAIPPKGRPTLKDGAAVALPTKDARALLCSSADGWLFVNWDESSYSSLKAHLAAFDSSCRSGSTFMDPTGAGHGGRSRVSEGRSQLHP